MSETKTKARSLSVKKPELVVHESYPGGRWDMAWPTYVADFTDDVRPAYRVKCHCRNCSWDGHARFPVGSKVPQWTYCPKCETAELSAHGEFVARDEKTRLEHLADVKAAYKKRDEMHARSREMRERERERTAAPSKKKGLFR